MSIANPKKSILRKNPYTDRRSFIARMNPLSPIGDIASGGLSESTGSGSVTWETATDWNNAADEFGVAHESVANTDHADDTQIVKGYSFSSVPYSANVVGFFPLNEDSGSTAYDVANGNNATTVGQTKGSTGLLNTTGYTQGNGDEIDVPHNTFSFGGALTYLIWANISSIDGSGHLWSDWSGSYRNHLCSFDGSDNSLQAISGNAGSSQGPTLQGSTSLSLNTDYLLGFRRDSSGNYDIIVDGSIDASQSSSYTGGNTPNDMQLAGYSADDPDYDNKLKGTVYMGAFWNTDLTATQLTDFYNVVAGESYLTTATKSFGTASTPNLSNLDYATNGQTLIVDVIGSPGTASEEVVSQTLGGSASYSLSWSSSHTDFRVKPRLSTSDYTTSPTVNSITLTA